MGHSMSIFKTISVIVLIFSAISSAKTADYQAALQRVDSLANSLQDRGLFSGQILIMNNGNEIFYKTYGYADWKNSIKFDKQTNFNICSLNKQFTEEIIHQLVKEKKLNYDDKISKHIDLFPKEIGDRITIKQLLDMKSGLGDYFRIPKFRKIENTDFTLTELLDIIKTEPLLFEPGTATDYSNSGYAVLGGIIEKVTKDKYNNIVKNRILNPLKISTFAFSKDEIFNLKNKAIGYELSFNKKMIENTDFGNSTPAGGAFTNITELAKFTNAKMSHNLPSAYQYRNGMFAGGTENWNTVISYDSQTNLSFVVMANTGDISDKLAPCIKAILNNQSFEDISQPFNIEFYNIIKDKGFDYVKSNIKEIMSKADLPYDPRFLNFFGYQYLNNEEIEIAIGLFKINTELFPDNANSFDSLAEAYLKNGQKDKAIINYKKAYAINKDEILRNRIESLEKEMK